MLARVDHLVYATPELERGISEVEKLLGVRAIHGGQHPGRGTRNALLALGAGAYLEIIGPDPDQPAPTSPRWFGIDDLETSKLVTWAAKTEDIDRVHRDAAANGIPIGEVRAGSRKRADGAPLSWRLTEPVSDAANGIIPFFIDWGRSPHPSESAPRGAALVALSAEHPEDQRVHRALQILGLELSVTRAPHGRLIAIVDGRHGRVGL
ncbi:MAG: VOC family protein [Deltaproteobacteria bacterium]